MKTNYIFKEVSDPDFMSFFDTDCYTEKAGSYEYTVFIIVRDHYQLYGLNDEAYKKLIDEITILVNDFEYCENHKREYSYRKAMEENGIFYNATKCHKLKAWYASIDYIEKPETLKEYLTIKTGKTWKTTSARGYVQSDYAEVLYCSDIYSENDIDVLGDLFFGCGKEFSLIETDENGQEDENTTVYGYFVADCQYRNDEELKTVLCSMEGIKPEETKVFTISNTYTTTHYEYVEV